MLFAVQREKKAVRSYYIDLYLGKRILGISKCYSFGQYRSVHGNGKFILCTKKDFEKKIASEIIE